MKLEFGPLKKVQALLQKNRQLRLCALLFLGGLMLYLVFSSLMPAAAENTPQESLLSAPQQAEPALGALLEQTLSEMEGVGEVSVLLTVEREKQTVYQTDQSSSQSESTVSEQAKTVLSSGEGLVQTVYAPVYRGAVIACEGADRPSVVLAIKSAVASATGLGLDKITVIKTEK